MAYTMSNASKKCKVFLNQKTVGLGSLIPPPPNPLKLSLFYKSDGNEENERKKKRRKRDDWVYTHFDFIVVVA